MASPSLPTTNTRRRYLFLGLLLRVTLLLWGLYQDANASLPYTDIDYSVFKDGTRHLVHGCPLNTAVPPNSDPMQDLLDFQSPPGTTNSCASGWLAIGSRYILQHEDVLVARSKGIKGAESARKQLGEDAALSLIEPNLLETWLLPFSLTLLKPILKPLAAMGNPYARSTFRYTPLLGVILVPGAWIGGILEELWGKLLFVLADLLAAVLMWDVAARRQVIKQESKPLWTDPVHAVGILWLLNPFPAQIATRGSSESVLSLLVLALTAAAVRLVSGGDSGEKTTKEKDTDDEPTNRNQDNTEKSLHASPATLDLPALPHEVILTPLLLALAVHLKIYPAIYGFSILSALMARQRLMDSTIFTFTSLYTFFGLSTIVYLIWGNEYLHNSITYHLTRIDHRHNFSPYFLPLYLNHVVAQPSGLLPASLTGSTMVSFAPQFLLTLLIAYKIAPKDITMAFFLQTFTFVLFNKVSTSQYFIWYLHFIPILLPTWQFSSTVLGWMVLVVWVASQALWLGPAYLLEFQGRDVFLLTWLAGLLYVAAQAWVIERCIDAWNRGRTRGVVAVERQ